MFGFTPQLGTGLTAGGGQTGLLMPQAPGTAQMGGAQGLLASPSAMPMQPQTPQINPQMMGAALGMLNMGKPQMQQAAVPQSHPALGGHLQLAALQSMLPYMMMQQQGVQHG